LTNLAGSFILIASYGGVFGNWGQTELALGTCLLEPKETHLNSF
jgi:hypothetical protein